MQTLRALESELHADGVRYVSVFGSVARGEDTPGSDVDLAPGTTRTGFQFVVYAERLRDKLTTALRCNVDIVILPARRQELKETLSREAILAF